MLCGILSQLRARSWRWLHGGVGARLDARGRWPPSTLRSVDTVRKTHSHYFANTLGDLVSELERELVSMLGRDAA